MPQLVINAQHTNHHSRAGTQNSRILVFQPIVASCFSVEIICSIFSLYRILNRTIAHILTHTYSLSNTNSSNVLDMSTYTNARFQLLFKYITLHRSLLLKYRLNELPHIYAKGQLL